MDVLTLIQEFTNRTGLPKPTYAVGNPDQTIRQVLALLNEILEDLTTRFEWSSLTRETTFVTVNGAEQGALTTLAPNGFKYILNDTIYNRTQQRELLGPAKASEWQAAKASGMTGTLYTYRITLGKLRFIPDGVAGDTCAFEYISSYAVLAADGTTYRAYPEADTDTFLLDDVIVLAGLRWKWKAEKGLDYAEDFRRYEELANNGKSRDATQPHLSMNAGDGEEARPAILVPSGSWSLP